MVFIFHFLVWKVNNGDHNRRGSVKESRVKGSRISSPPHFLFYPKEPTGASKEPCWTRPQNPPLKKMWLFLSHVAPAGQPLWAEPAAPPPPCLLQCSAASRNIDSCDHRRVERQGRSHKRVSSGGEIRHTPTNAQALRGCRPPSSARFKRKSLPVGWTN